MFVDKISLINEMGKIFNEELNLIKQDLPSSGNVGDIITKAIISGAEVEECSITVDNEIYVTFANGDVIKGAF